MINAFKYIRFDQLLAFYFSVFLGLSCLTLIPIEFDALQLHWLTLILAVLVTKANPLSFTRYICIRRSDVLHPERMANKLLQLLAAQCLMHGLECGSSIHIDGV